MSLSGTYEKNDSSCDTDEKKCSQADRIDFFSSDVKVKIRSLKIKNTRTILKLYYIFLKLDSNKSVVVLCLVLSEVYGKVIKRWWVRAQKLKTQGEF